MLYLNNDFDLATRLQADLTLTSVVFELDTASITAGIAGYLTLTSVVFEFSPFHLFRATF